MRKLLLLLVAVCATLISFSQTTLINPAGDGGFETGATIAANNWVAANSSTDAWVVGNTSGVSAGARAAFISPDAGTSWTYTQFSVIQHLYYTVTVPTGETKITLNFKWKATGEGTTTSDWDNIKVFFVPSTTTPVANTALSSGQISGPGAISGMYKLSSAAYNSETIVFSAPAGSYRLVFSWKSDVSTIANPPAAIDEVSLVSAVPATITSTGTGGLWSAPATWAGGVVPTASDNVVIADGTTVTIDVAAATAAQCLNLTVGQGTSGVLQYQATPAAGLTVNSGVVTVAANGSFNAGSGTLFTHVLNIGGTSASNSVPSSIVNNGVFDMNGVTAGVLTTFYGTQDGTISGTGSTTNFYTITVNKGTTQTGAMLDITSIVTIAAPTSSTVSRLSVTSGTLRISSATVATPYFGSQTICAANGRLWLNNASASLQCVGTGTNTGTGSPTVTGELRIDNGTFGYGSGNNTLTFTSGSGVLRMNGGTLNMYGAVSFPSSSSTQLLLSGGAINVKAQAANSLGVGTALFSIGASTTVVWSAGTITIVDPHAATAGTAWTATTGGIKTITGGTLFIGDGTSVLTGGATANTNGFGLLSTMPVYNLVINNRTDGSLTRVARLVGGVTVNNNLTINANSYLFLGSATTTQTLTVKGNIIQNGILAGCEPGGTQVIGTLYLNGQTGAQTLSGSGTFVNNSTITLDNVNSTGITFSNSNLYKVNRVNLFDGSLNPGSNFTIGNASALTGEIPIIQYGVSAALAAGTFTSFPTLDESDGPRTLIYSLSTNNYTLGFNGEIGTGAQTITQLLVNNSTGVTVPATITSLNINSTLTMTLGNINLNGASLTLGTSATVTGTLSYTAGLIQGGTFTRWFGTSALPTAIANGNGGHFPIGYNNTNRNVWLFFTSATGLSVGGTITVNHVNAGGLTSVTGFTDGGVTVDTRTNSSWTISQSGCTLTTGTITARIQGTSVANVGTVANLRMIRATDAVGTSANGTNSATDPQVNRTGMTLAMLANTFYIGAPSADLIGSYTTIASGNWEDASTWYNGIVPTSANNAFIYHNVTVNANPVNANALTVLASGLLTVSGSNLTLAGTLTNNGMVNISGGTLAIPATSTTGITNASTGLFTVSGGIVNLGITDNTFCNRTLTNNGTLTVSSGTLNVFGNVSSALGSTFNQSGGNINIDGNAGGSTANSVASGTALLQFKQLNSGINLTGGTLTIVDPHAATTASNSIGYDVATAGTQTSLSTHTTRFGDGVSTDAGGNAVGFNIDNWTTTGYLALGSVVVNGPSGTNRGFTSTYQFTAHGDVTVNNGGILNIASLIFGGNLSVNTGGIFNNSTAAIAAKIASNTSSGLTFGYATVAQTITNSGTIRNSATTPTANFTGFQVTNNSVGGITFGTGIPSPTFSGAITISDGKVTATDITLQGSSAQAVTLTAATSIINTSNFTLNNSAGATLSGSGRLNVTGTANITTGVLASAGLLTIKSLNETATGTGRITALAAGAITGNVNIERYFAGSGSAFPVSGNSKRGFRFVGHPLSTSIGLNQINAAGGVSISGTGGATNGFQVTGTNNPSAFWYNPTIAGAGSNTTVGAGASAAADPGWVAFTGTNGAGVNAWAKGQGIRFLFRGDQTQGLLSNADYTMNPATITFTGAVNIGPVTTNLTSASSGTTAGYNIIGNPLPSPIDVSLTTSRTNMDANFYVFDPSIGNRGGYSAAKPFATSYILPVGGAFVANVTTLGTAASITFPEACKASGQTDNLFRNYNNNSYVKLRLEGANMFWDELNFEFADKYKAETEYEDGAKFINSDVNFYSITKDNSRLSLDYRKLKDGEVIPLGLVTNQARSFTIKVDDVKLNAGTTLYLVDKYLNVQTKIEPGATYDFATTTDAASQGEGRFEIGMKQSPSVLPVIASTFSVKLSPNPATDVVKVSFTNVDQANTTISIVSAEGKTVKTVAAGNVQNGQVSVNVKGLAKGTYYVTLNNGTDKKTEKLVIQ